MLAGSESSLVAFGSTLKRCSAAGVDAFLLSVSLEKGNLVSMASTASMTEVIKTEGSDTVGEAVSSLVIQLRILLPSAQALPFLVPSRFSVMKINDRKTRLRSSGVRVWK